MEGSNNNNKVIVRRKKRLNKEQVRQLERSFTTNKKLDTELKQKLANQLGVPARQVAIWYQNKRARWKTQSLELDYNTVQLRLETALADKRRLEKDVEQLEDELRQAQEMLAMANHNQNQKGSVETTEASHQNHQNYYYSSGSNSHELSGDHDHDHDQQHHHHHRHQHHHHEGRLHQIDHELFACLIGNGGGGGGGSAWA